MALRIIPADTHLSTFTHTPSRHNIAPSAPGLHDTLRAGLSADPFAPSTQPISSHPLESRLKNWEATREALRMETLRRTYGIAEPIRRQMELKICRESEWKPMCLPGSGTPSLHEDILSGKDTTIEWEDVFTGGDEELRGRVGVLEEMERKVKMAPQ